MGDAIVRTDVPCNGCTACCRDEAILLCPDLGDNPQLYETIERTISGKPVLMIAQKDGHCVYLGDHGCTIRDYAPALCRAFDCRRNFLQYTRNERRRILKAGLANKEVFEAGRKRLHTLEADNA